MSSTIKIKRGTRQAITDLAIKGGLSEGEPLLITDEGRMAVATAPTSFSNSAMLSDTFGFKNKIHNGKMEIAQRGTSFAAIASGAYSLDRWWVVTDSVGTVNVSQVDISTSGTGFRKAIRVERTAGTNRWTIGQNLETSDVVPLRGSTVTLSFWARKGAALTSNIDVGLSTRSTEAKFGAAVDFAGLTIPNASISASSFTRFTLQLTIPANSTAPGLCIEFQANQAGAANAFFDITGVQLEVGSVATPFEHRPFGIEEIICKRYFQRLARLLSYGQSSTGILIHCMLPVPMRITPAASLNTTTPYWENAVFSTIGTLTGATVNVSHFSSVGGTILINGTFSPAPTYGSMSEFDGNSIFLSSDL